MRVMLLAAAGSLAALAAGTGPAAAQQFAADGFSGGHHGRHGGGFIDGQRFDRDFTCGLRDRSNRDIVDRRRGHHGRDGRRDRGRDHFCDGFLGYYGGAWAYYNNRTWDPDSYNGWWHDRPDRAYPRWVQHNQNCDRMWWGGGVWRCNW
ncbi:MAG TPA: hypothetical protein VJ597_03480 [Sphingomicrobium sp.]|nr:hypothetical protein [Sphingomicrobium sp.]